MIIVVIQIEQAKSCRHANNYIESIQLRKRGEAASENSIRADLILHIAGSIVTLETTGLWQRLCPASG